MAGSIRAIHSWAAFKARVFILYYVDLLVCNITILQTYYVLLYIITVHILLLVNSISTHLILMDLQLLRFWAYPALRFFCYHKAIQLQINPSRSRMNRCYRMATAHWFLVAS